MVEDYSQFKIKEYSLWDLFLHEKQFPYVGRCYAWAKRDDAKQVTDMSFAEREELFSTILPDWDKSVSELFNHDWANVAILGNTTPHLHVHLIPRYHSPITVAGIEFIDPNPQGNYAPYPKKSLPLEFLLKIKEDITEKL